jgi:hypothetical protein
MEQASELELSPREQHHVDELMVQFAAIVDKAPTTEARMQKSINTSVYLMDRMMLRGKNIMEATIRMQQDPSQEKEIKQQLSKQPFLPQVRIVA